MLSVEKGIDTWLWESEERGINSNCMIQGWLHERSDIKGRS